MDAFLTGSRVYGEPTETSDVDLVVIIHDHKSRELLRKLSDNGKLPIRFGKLNLIICENEKQFLAWKIGTEIMAKRAREEPRRFSKGEATDLLDEYREALGVTSSEDSGGDDPNPTEEGITSCEEFPESQDVYERYWDEKSKRYKARRIKKEPNA